MSTDLHHPRKLLATVFKMSRDAETARRMHVLTLHFWSQELITLATRFKCSLMHQIRTSSWKLTKRAGGGKGGWEAGQRSFIHQYHTPVSCEVWCGFTDRATSIPLLACIALQPFKWELRGGGRAVHAVCLMSASIVSLLPCRMPWFPVCMLGALIH